MSTRTANALADALTEAIEEEVQNIDTALIVDQVIEDMRGEFVTENDLSSNIENEVDEYISNHDLPDRYEVQKLIDKSMCIDEILSQEEIVRIIETSIAEAKAYRVLLRKGAAMWHGFAGFFDLPGYRRRGG